MLQQRKLKDQTTGSYAGPRGSIGQYPADGLTQTSGTTYGGIGDGAYWDLMPNIISGQTEYDPMASTTGSNLSAVQQLSNGNYYNSTTAIDAGLDGAPTGSANGGISY